MKRVRIASVSVMDLACALDEWMGTRGSRDLMGMTAELQQMSWKTAARPSLLADFSDLASLLVKMVL